MGGGGRGSYRSGADHGVGDGHGGAPADDDRLGARPAVGLDADGRVDLVGIRLEIAHRVLGGLVLLVEEQPIEGAPVLGAQHGRKGDEEEEDRLGLARAAARDDVGHPRKKHVPDGARKQFAARLAESTTEDVTEEKKREHVQDAPVPGHDPVFALVGRISRGVDAREHRRQAPQDVEPRGAAVLDRGAGARRGPVDVEPGARGGTRGLEPPDLLRNRVQGIPARRAGHGLGAPQGADEIPRRPKPRHAV